VNDGKVSAKKALCKDSVSRALSLDWHRLDDEVGRGTLMDHLGCKGTKTISGAISRDHVPELHTVLNSLLADPTALLNTFNLYGGVFVPVEHGECDDNTAISQMLRAATEYFERMKDGVRDHNDTLALAELFRPLIPAMLCVIREAGALRGLDSSVVPISAGRAA
jgi:hypothetical protein